MKKLLLFVFVFISAVFMVACSKKDYEFSFNMGQKIGVGETTKIEMNMEEGMTFAKFTFRTDDESVLKVAGSYLTGVSEGIASVFASYEGKEVELMVSVVGVRNMTYNLDGATCDGLKDKVYKGEIFVLPTPVKEGFIFQGWYSNPSFSGDAITELNSSNNVSNLYAKFRSENYTINYSLFIDGKENRTTGESKFESDFTLAEPDYDKSKYVFSGWFLDNNYYESISVVEKGYNNDIKVYGLLVTKGTQITLKYNTNGGVVSGGNSVNVEAGSTNLANPTRSGYSFVGWYKDSKCEYPVTGGIYKNTTVYAKWNENVPVTEVNITNTNPEVKKHETLQIEYKLNPENPTVGVVTYKSSDTSILTVDKYGVVSGLKVGKAVVTVTSSSQTGASATIEVEVFEPDFFEVSYETNSYVTKGQTIKLNAVAHLRGTNNPELEWTSSDTSVATVKDGVVTGVSDGFVSISASVKGKSDFSYTFGVTVYSNNTSSVLKHIIENNQSNVLIVEKLGIGAGNPVYYTDIVSSVNRLMFNYKYTIDRQYESVQAGISSNHGEPMESVEFITVHYTGNMNAGATAKANANYFASGGGGTSIHYVTGNDGIYHCLADNLVGFHAGDGHSSDTKAAWYPTGIMYKEGDPIYPKWGISADSTFTLNGTDTKIKVPTGSTAATTKVTDSRWINDMGLAYTIIDGQYYMGKTWWCYSQISEGRICNKGGNMNSIGIESAVNQGSDLWYTWQLTSQLVAHLMVENNLPIQRVVGHHFYSAKNCPQPMLENNLQLWWEFIELVKAEYEMITTYKDYTYKMELVEANENVSVNGRVLKVTNPYQTITYKVTVTDKAGKSESVTLSSIVPGNYIK